MYIPSSLLEQLPLKSHTSMDHPLEACTTWLKSVMYYQDKLNTGLYKYRTEKSVNTCKISSSTVIPTKSRYYFVLLSRTAMSLICHCSPSFDWNSIRPWPKAAAKNVVTIPLFIVSDPFNPFTWPSWIPSPSVTTTKSLDGRRIPYTKNSFNYRRTTSMAILLFYRCSQSTAMLLDYCCMLTSTMILKYIVSCLFIPTGKITKSPGHISPACQVTKLMFSSVTGQLEAIMPIKFDVDVATRCWII